VSLQESLMVWPTSYHQPWRPHIASLPIISAHPALTQNAVGTRHDQPQAKPINFMSRLAEQPLLVTFVLAGG